MPAFMKLGDIKGEATDTDHKDWVIIESMSSRSSGQSTGSQRPAAYEGGNDLGDVVTTRQLDMSSTKLQEACANGTFFKEVEVHFCTTVKNKQEPYLTYKLSDVILLAATAFMRTPQAVRCHRTDHDGLHEG